MDINLEQIAKKHASELNKSINLQGKNIANNLFFGLFSIGCFLFFALRK